MKKIIISQVMAIVGIACVILSKPIGFGIHNDILTLSTIIVGMGLYIAAIPIVLKSLKDSDTWLYTFSIATGGWAVLTLTFGAHIIMYVTGIIAAVIAIVCNILFAKEILSEKNHRTEEGESDVYISWSRW